MTTTPLLLDSIDPGTARLYGIVARAVASGSACGLGPRDRHHHLGQWFKGRVYERRCDLSP